MKFKSKRRLRIIKQYGFAWTFAFLYYSFLRGEGTQELGSTQFEFWDSVIACLIMGTIFGSISGYAQMFYWSRICLINKRNCNQNEE